ncbi:MAG: trypsin-like peptidase domain-containing protein [Candidatus Saccharicenans sp.]|nr:trypsin-like peptidase domain-containing protein [Candidatus Saccharicenans sp.]
MIFKKRKNYFLCYLGLATMFLATFVSPGFPEAQTSQSWKAVALQALARLQVENKDGSKLTGMVFLAVKDGLGLTSLDLVKNAGKALAVFPSGEEYGTTGLVDLDPKTGVALIKLRLFGQPLLSLRGAGPTDGEPVYFGVNREGDFGLVEGKVGAKETGVSSRFYSIVADLPAGNSGAPVFDKDGLVVGMLSWQGNEGSGRYVLVPSGHMLALDASLPTQPWAADAVREGTETAAPEAVSLETMDAMLAEACLVLDNLQVWHGWEDIRTGGQGFLSGVDKELYSAQQQTEQILKKVAGQKVTDQLRKEAIMAVLEIGSKQYNGVEEFIKSVVIGQQFKDWNAQAQDMYRRSQATLETVESLKQAKKSLLRELYEKSSVFQEKLPKAVAYNFGLLDRPSNFKLGLVSFAQDEFYVMATKKGSLAGKLGLWGGDRIISAAGRSFGPEDTIEDFKLVLMSNLGKQIEVVVERNGKPKVLKMKVPAEIPSEYLYR